MALILSSEAGANTNADTSPSPANVPGLSVADMQRMINLLTASGKKLLKTAREDFKMTQRPVDRDRLVAAGTISMCSWCDVESKRRLCTRCKYASYCSAECQRADWPEHKKTCFSSSSSRNVFRFKTITLASRAFVIPNLCQFLMLICHITLSLDTHPENAKTHSCLFKWDLVPVMTPPEYYHKTGAKDRRDEFGEQRYMLKLVSAEAVTNNEISRDIQEARERDPLEDEVNVNSEEGPLLVPCLSQSVRYGDRTSVFWTNMPIPGDLRVPLRMVCTNPVLGAMRARESIGGKEQIIKALNEGIILDTKNDWRLRTRLKDDD